MRSMQHAAAEWAGWTVTGVQSLLDAVYWTEPVDEEWSWCVECESLVPTAAVADHVCSEHRATASSDC